MKHVILGQPMPHVPGPGQQQLRFWVGRTRGARGGMTWTGQIILPVGMRGAIPVQAQGKTQQQALSNAAGLAESILDSPLLKAALPPGSGLAIEAIKGLAGSKDIKKALGKLTGEGAKRIGGALSKLKFW